jgi:hypothetical protein
VIVLFRMAIGPPEFRMPPPPVPVNHSLSAMVLRRTFRTPASLMTPPEWLSRTSTSSRVTSPSL